MKIYEPDTFEYKVWQLHFDGFNVIDISERIHKPYSRIKDIILEGWRRQDPQYRKSIGME